MAVTDKMHTNVNPTKVRVLMWSVTSPLADFLFWLSNLVLIVGAAAVLIGTIGAIVMSGARERFSNERISANEAATARAVADSKLANAEALKAQLQLAQYQAPRSLAPQVQAAMVQKLKPFASTPFAFCILPEPEPIGLMNQLAGVLVAAGWTPADFPITGGLRVSAPNGKNAGIINSFAGLQLEIPVTRAAEWQAPMIALLKALAAAGLQVTAQRDLPGKESTTEALAIFIGKKP